MVNVAMTSFVASMVTWQVKEPVEEQLLLQPEKVVPVDGAAVSVIRVPLVYTSVQSAPQSIPSGEEVTDPLPLPDFVTVNWKSSVNVAVTVFAWSTVVWQVYVPVTVQLPLQPLNDEPISGAAVRVTTVP
jgi:hypothetical protein